MRGILQDLRFGFRVLKKEPGLTLAAVLSIAIGVAANTTVFTMVNKVLFQPLPIKQPGSLYSIYDHYKKGNPGASISWPDYQDIRAEKSVFDDVAAYFPLVPASLTMPDSQPKRLWGQLVTGNYFTVANVQPALGRGFRPEEDSVPDRDFVVVISHQTWTSQFASDPSIAGRIIRLNQRAFTVIGVAPQGFRGTDAGLVADFWIPFSLLGPMLPSLGKNLKEPSTARDNHWLFSITRLANGVTMEAAQSALHAIAARIEKDSPATNKDRTFYIERAGQFNPGLRGPVMGFLGLLLAVMMMVLLIACANVANLLLARSARRQREIATRLAIGAGRGRLIRQLLTESFILAALGAGAAVILTRMAQEGIANIQLPFPVPLDFSTSFDWRVAAFAIGLTLLTNLLFGLAPALRAGRTDLVTGLRVQTGDGAASRKRFRMANILVVAQVATALLLLTGSVLVLRSLRNAHSVDVGFRTENLLLLTLDPALDGIESRQTSPLLKQVQNRLRSLPGVASVSYTDMLPLSIGGQRSSIHNEEEHGQAAPKTTGADFYTVGEDYLTTLGLPLASGSADFGTRGNGAIPAVVNEVLAQKVWPGQNAIGKRFYAMKSLYEVTGVARNSKSRTLGEAPQPAFYRFFDKAYEGEAILGIRMMVRTRTPPAALAGTVRQEMKSNFPNISVYDIQTMDEHLRNAQVLPRVAAFLFGFAGGSALLLALTGLFGVIHYSVSRRTREIGIRMALGAGRESILAMVLRQGMTLALIGSALGFGASMAASRIMGSLLYGISPNDPVTFTLVPFVLMSTASLACLLPAWRASRLAPGLALREE